MANETVNGQTTVTAKSFVIFTVGGKHRFPILMMLKHLLK